MKKFAPFLLASSCLALLHCGGGGGGGSDEATIRPKSLHNVMLIPDGGTTIRLRFQRENISSLNDPNSLSEKGFVVYTVAGQVQIHNSIAGSSFDAVWPNEAGSLDYLYTPINDGAGVVTITSRGAKYLIPTVPVRIPDIERLPRGGRTGINSTINVKYFSSGTDRITKFIMNFNANGGALGPVSLRIEPNSTADVDIVDDLNLPINNPGLTIDQLTYTTKATIALVTGAAVPINYDVPDDVSSQIYSNLANASLNGKSVVFTSTTIPAGSVQLSSITFASATPSNNVSISESGTATITETNPGAVPPSNVTSDGGSYLYENIVNSHNTNITLSGGAQPGSVITISYLTKELTSGSTITQNASGTYTVTGGVYDGDSGTFVIRNK